MIWTVLAQAATQIGTAATQAAAAASQPHRTHSAVAIAIHNFLNHFPVVARVFIIVLAVLIINAILHWVFSALARRADRHKRIWSEALLGSISAPLQTLIWIAGLSLAIRILTREGTLSLLSDIYRPARAVANIAVVAWFLLRVVTRVQANLQVYARERGYELDVTATDAIGKLVRAAIIITAALVAMQALDVPISGLLAFGGIGGIAIGFAAQGLVANLFGGLTIYASRPFKVGEYIIIPANDLRGQVQHIGWRATRVMGFDRMPFYVPNSIFNTAVVINFSRMTNRRIQEHMHFRYRDASKAPAVIAAVNKMLGEHPGIEHDFFVFRFDTCGDFSMKVLLYAFTVSTDYSEFMRVKEDILLKIEQIVREHGGELAVPVSTLYAPDGIEMKKAPDRHAELMADLVERPEGK